MAARVERHRDSAVSVPPAAGSPHGGAGGRSALEVIDVDKTYDTRAGAVEALRGATFSAGRGEFVAMVGPSGCGKSTLLKILAGLEELDAGMVTVAGRPAATGRRDCGIMLQSPVLLPWRTVVDNVLLPVEIFGMSGDAARQRADELLDLVGLTDFNDKYPWELSGGMQQRVSLARLLVFEPDVLLMDEPFGALDEFTRERMNFELASLHERLGKLVVFVTHNILEAVVLSDKVVVMKPRPGEVIEVVDIDLPRPRTRDVLDDPRTVEIVKHIRHLLVAHSEEA